MKHVKKLVAIILTAAMGLSLTLSVAVKAAEQPKYPESIAGYPVIFVKTPENTYGLATGQIVLVLLDRDPWVEKPKEQASLQAIGLYLSNNELPQGWTIELVGGPDTTKEKFEKRHAESQERLKRLRDLGDYPVSGPISETGTREYTGRTYAVVRNDDALIYTVDRLSATIDAIPQVGSYQDLNSQMLVNGKTNTGYFIQAGQKYPQNGAGYNMWTDTDWTSQPQEFDNVEYYEGEQYEFEVGLSVSTWFAKATNLTRGGSATQTVFRRGTGTGGTYFVFDTNTSVFFENTNTDWDWYTGFTNPIRVRWAWVRRSGSYYPWYYQQIIIIDSNNQVQANNGIITGSLLNLGSADWHLDDVLVVQPP